VVAEEALCRRGIPLVRPPEVETLRLVQDSARAGRQRGAPVQEIDYFAVGNDVTAVFSCCGRHAPSRTVLGGLASTAAARWLVRDGGAVEPLPNVVTMARRQGEARVLEDVLENCKSGGKADAVYGVWPTGATERDRLAVHAAATEAPSAARRRARRGGGRDDG